MNWVDVLAIFNFVAWLLPIIVRTWMAWKYDSTSEHTISDQELGNVKRAVAKLNLRGKRLKIGSDPERAGNNEEGSK